MVISVQSEKRTTPPPKLGHCFAMKPKEDFRASMYLRKNRIQRSATLTSQPRQKPGQASERKRRVQASGRLNAARCRVRKKALKSTQSVKALLPSQSASKSDQSKERSLPRPFTYASGLSTEHANRKGTSHLLRFLGKLRGENRITIDERTILREAILNGHNHTIRVLSQMNSFSLGSSADKVLTNLLEDLISRDITTSIDASAENVEVEKKNGLSSSGAVETALIHGVLYKKRAFGLLVPRYFVLIDDEFRYYDARTGKKLTDGSVHYSDVKAKGKYPHNKYISIKDVAETKLKCCFELQVNKTKSLILKAKSRDEKQLWLTAIAEWIVGGGKIKSTSMYKKKHQNDGDSAKVGSKEKSLREAATPMHNNDQKYASRNNMPVSKKNTLSPTTLDSFLSSTGFEMSEASMVKATKRDGSSAVIEGTLLFRDMQQTAKLEKWAEVVMTLKERNLVIVFSNDSSRRIRIVLDSKLKLRVSARNDFQFSISLMNSRQPYTFLAGDKAEYHRWIDTIACAIKDAGKQWSRNKRRSIIIAQELSDSATSNGLCKSISKPSSQIISNGTSPQRKQSNDSVGKNIKSENMKESEKDTSVKSKVEPSYTGVASTANKNSVHNKSRRLGGVRASRSWDRLRRHVKSASLENIADHGIVGRNRAATSLHHMKISSASSEMQKFSPIISGLDPSPSMHENVTAESKKLLHSKSLRSRRHSTNTIGNFRGKNLNFQQLHLNRKVTFESFNNIPDLDKFWDGIYENNDEAENEISSLSFEERILSLRVKNREKSPAHKNMLKKSIDTLRKNTAHVSKLSSSLFNRIDRNGVDELVDEMFLVEVPANCTVIEKGAAGEYFYIVEAGRFVPSDEDVEKIMGVQGQDKMNANAIVPSTQIVRSKRHSLITTSSRLNANSSSQIGAGPGDCFGHEALFHEAPRGATVKTDNVPGMLWVLSKHKFQDVARRSMKRIGLLKRRVMRFVPFLKQFLESSEIKALGKFADYAVARPNEFLLYRQVPSKVIILVRGCVEVTEKDLDSHDETVYSKSVTECIGIECLLINEEVFSSYNKNITVQAVGNQVHYMTFTLDDIDEALNEARYQKFISYVKFFYDNTNEARIKNSIATRRKTASLASRNRQSNRIENRTSTKVVKNSRKPKRFSVQTEAGKFRRRRSVMIMRKSITDERNNKECEEKDGLSSLDVVPKSPSKYKRRRRSNFVKLPEGIEISSFSIASDTDSYTDEGSSQRDVNSPIPKVDEPFLESNDENISDAGMSPTTGVKRDSSDPVDEVDAENKALPNTAEKIDNKSIDPCNLAEENVCEVKSPVDNSSPPLHEAESIANEDAPEGNDSNQKHESLVEMPGPITDEYEDDEGARLSIYDTTADEMTESEESDDDFDNKDLLWDDGSYLSPDIRLEDLTVHKTLGHGAFSKVKLVSAKYDFFALKCMERTYIVENDCQDMIDNELAALKELNGSSKFVMGLHGAFATEKMIFFLTELCPGGELYGHLRDQENGAYTEENAQFYAACVVEGLRAIHAKTIVYRDLKMENLIIDEVGYLKIVDFGLAKKTEKTFTSCGTPEYMSPEMILNSGHNRCVDYWAFGILMFELVNGVTPFVGGEVMETYENILEHKPSETLSYKYEISNNFQRLVRGLLKKRPSRRLGSRRGVVDILSSPFFETFDFDELRNRSLAAPFLPSDGSNASDANEEDGGHLVLSDVDWKDVAKDPSAWQPNV